MCCHLLLVMNVVRTWLPAWVLCRRQRCRIDVRRPGRVGAATGGAEEDVDLVEREPLTPTLSNARAAWMEGEETAGLEPDASPPPQASWQSTRMAKVASSLPASASSLRGFVE